MKIFTKIFFIAVILGSTCVFGASKTKAPVQNTGCQKPTVSVNLKKTTPTYRTKPYAELSNICHAKSVLGCTLSTYGCTYSIFLNKKGCKQLDITCSPNDFQVYILSEYPEGTCEYEAIKKHENFHVSAIQNFPEKSMENYLVQCIDEEIKKKKIKTGEQIYTKCAQKTELWLNRRIDDKNHEIDSYKKYDPLYFSKCKNWKMHDWEIEAHLDMKD